MPFPTGHIYRPAVREQLHAGQAHPTDSAKIRTQEAGLICRETRAGQTGWHGERIWGEHAGPLPRAGICVCAAGRDLVSAVITSCAASLSARRNCSMSASVSKSRRCWTSSGMMAMSVARQFPGTSWPACREWAVPSGACGCRRIPAGCTGRVRYVPGRTWLRREWAGSAWG